MAAKNKKTDYCMPGGTGLSCCKVESVVSIDERGQMVLPKETRKKANIKAGDKLAIISWQKDEKVSFICLIRVEELAEMIKGMFGPIMQDVLK